ncbi:hypothetical protein JKA74_14150 [Marivirga sp. S37H4]|uniref:Metal-dependent HD superfamily phosphohydrolase n=1 Tax=Marivirga aurantiaca TaxID=2802615 RepID=A0A934WZP3_9BACT|nr:hypothetical protein [Marivirga aurantiaca]MBK6266183.1 hypothetical protein [Marivirga aurantiaca]
MMKEVYQTSLRKFTSDEQQISSMWKEIERCYCKKGRYYHTLTHLNNLTHELQPLKDQFSHWDTVVMAIAYHDIIYNPLKSNNEEKSADLAVKRLESISYPTDLATLCKQMILATKSHEAGHPEINLFTDADLSILGSEPEVYKNYTAQIRKEYKIYPDMLYYPGRKKVLRHFLEMERIYQSEHFYNQYETKARLNLNRELKEIENKQSRI